MTEADQRAFRLSRVYAEGWNAGQDAASRSRSITNPYRSEPERMRWSEGYAEASARNGVRTGAMPHTACPPAAAVTKAGSSLLA